jgi:hypothetical protein
MASLRQIQANQANAQNSTGPRTSKGREKVAKNAFKHGLSSDHIFDQEQEQKVERLTKLLCSGQDDVCYELARNLAESQIFLNYIRDLQQKCYQSRHPKAKISPKNEKAPSQTIDEILQILLKDPKATEEFLKECEGIDKEMDFFIPHDEIDGVMRSLSKLDRYEKAAFSRRNRALKQFNLT